MSNYHLMTEQQVKSMNVVQILEIADTAAASKGVMTSRFTADDLIKIAGLISQAGPEQFMSEDEDGLKLLPVGKEMGVASTIIGLLILNERNGEITFEPTIHTRDFTKNMLRIILDSLR